MPPPTLQRANRARVVWRLHHLHLGDLLVLPSLPGEITPPAPGPRSLFKIGRRCRRETILLSEN